MSIDFEKLYGYGNLDLAGVGLQMASSRVAIVPPARYEPRRVWFASKAVAWLNERVDEVRWAPDAEPKAVPREVEDWREAQRDAYANAETPEWMKATIEAQRIVNREQSGAMERIKRAAKAKPKQYNRATAEYDPRPGRYDINTDSIQPPDAKPMSVVEYNAMRQAKSGRHLPYVYQQYPMTLYGSEGRSKIVRDAAEHEMWRAIGWTEKPPPMKDDA